MNVHAPAPIFLASLTTPLTMQRPRVIEFGAGSAPIAGRWAAEQRLTRVLVVADGFNAGRVDLLALKSEATVFGDVRPEPDMPNLEAALALAEAVKPDLVIGFG